MNDMYLPNMAGDREREKDRLKGEPVTIRVVDWRGRPTEEYTAYNAVGVVEALKEIMESVGTVIAKVEVTEDCRQIDITTDYVLD